MQRLVNIADKMQEHRASHGLIFNVGIGAALQHHQRALEGLDDVAMKLVVVARLERGHGIARLDADVDIMPGENGRDPAWTDRSLGGRPSSRRG